MKDYKVSVIIPIYNVEKVLGRCINSVINQTYKNIEIILVNDGSKDSCKEICEEFVAKDDRCRFIDIENAGVGNARNKGLEVATGDYVVFIDSDDVIVDCYIEVLLGCAVDNDLNIVSCAFREMLESEVVESWQYDEPNIHVVDVKEQYDYTSHYAKRNVCGVIINRVLLLSMKFDTDLYVGEDMYFFSKLLVQCDRVGYVDSALYGYVIYAKSATRGRYDQKKLTVVNAFERMGAVLESYPRLKQKCNALFALECAEALKWINYYKLDKNEFQYKKLSNITKKYFINVLESKKSIKIKAMYVWQVLLPGIYYYFFGLKQDMKNNVKDGR